ncbi:MAG: SdiA-regulated domain-containing protein [Azoarcus sp.]|nr:SdiA-regulated domain-containing protein [Azoarcus sp.]
MRLVLPSVLLVLVVGAAWNYRLAMLAWHFVSIPSRAPGSLRLAEYRVTLEAHPIEGLTANSSALTYNGETDTLFTTVNHPPQIVELTREGKVVRQLPVAGVEDLEGITHMEGNLFAIIDERRQQIYRVAVDADTRRVDVQGAPRLGLGILQSGNFGFEGISWDEENHRLFVAKEKSPRVFEIDGLPPLMDGSDKEMDLQIHEWQPRQHFRYFMRDLSSLSRSNQNGHMLLLSDESRLLAEYSGEGELVGLMPLWRGWHGLATFVPLAEGVTVGRDGTIYLISEPNLFYRFERNPAHQQK